MVATGLELAAVLRPVRAGNAFEETVECLLTAIRLGLVGPGEKFPPERDLAAQLGISRLTLREAIRSLQQAGFVESRRGRFGGTFVTARPPAPGRAELRRMAREDGGRLADALTFRLAVETGAAQLLAEAAAGPPAGRDHRGPGGPADGAARGRAGGVPAAGHAAAPVDRRAHRVSAAGRRPARTRGCGSATC